MVKTANRKSMNEREKELKRIKSNWKNLSGKEITEQVLNYFRTYTITQLATKEVQSVPVVETPKDLLSIFDGGI